MKADKSKWYCKIFSDNPYDYVIGFTETIFHMEFIFMISLNSILFCPGVQFIVSMPMISGYT